MRPLRLPASITAVEFAARLLLPPVHLAPSAECAGARIVLRRESRGAIATLRLLVLVFVALFALQPLPIGFHASIRYIRGVAHRRSAAWAAVCGPSAASSTRSISAVGARTATGIGSNRRLDNRLPNFSVGWLTLLSRCVANRQSTGYDQDSEDCSHGETPALDQSCQGMRIGIYIDGRPSHSRSTPASVQPCRPRCLLDQSVQPPPIPNQHSEELLLRLLAPLLRLADLSLALAKRQAGKAKFADTLILGPRTAGRRRRGLLLLRRRLHADDLPALPDSLRFESCL
jgi:hypothetical protein